MAAFTTGKVTNLITTKRCVREIFLTFIRNKNSRYLGYYMRKLSSPVFRKRQVEYRKNVLRPLEEIPTLEERLQAMNAPDPVLDVKIDIGFSVESKSKVSVKDRLEWHRRVASLKFKSAVEGEITKINLSEVHKDWLEIDGPAQMCNIAEHYGIYKALYDHGIFTPYVPLCISYDFDENTINPVCMGNILQASDVSKVPNVDFASVTDDLWTLILTNVDGHLLDSNSEYLHWFVGNIQGNDLKSGEVICDYLQPFPMRGTGYHRLVFVLYKQDKKIDYSSLKKISPCVNLKERTFKTFDFYKEHQDILTPAGLSFFQCTWDESLTDFFHNVLNMQEPVFEYIEPPLYIKPQVHFPHLEPFNLYLDRYRDPKEIKKEVLLKRLQNVEPFKEEPPMPKYPCLHKPDGYRFSWQRYLDRYRDPKEIKKEVLLKRLQNVEPFKEEPPMPKYPCLHKPDGYRFSWQRQDFKLQRLRQSKYRDLRPHSVYPQEDNQFPYWTKA